MVQHPVVELIITCEGGRHTLLDEQSNFIERKTCYIRQLTGTSFPTNATFTVRIAAHRHQLPHQRYVHGAYVGQHINWWCHL